MTGTAYRANPYLPPCDLWTEEKHRARAAMPLTGLGQLIQPKFLLKASDQEEHTRRWRAWSQHWPPHLWPVWLASWLEAHPA